MPVFRKDGKSVLFIHVPKCGGSTIETVFKNSGYQTLYLDGKVGTHTVNHLRKCTPQHMHAEMLEQIFRIENFSLVFMVVRNPLSRFKSEYIWRNRKKFTGTDSKSVRKWAERSFSQYEFNKFMYDNHLRPQSEFYTPTAEVHRFEDGFQNILNRLNERHQLSLTTEIPRLKDAKERTGFSSSDVVVSPDVENRISQFYRQDYEAFEYH